jgi:hypothetical protein
MPSPSLQLSSSIHWRIKLSTNLTKDELPTHEEMVDNIIKVYNSADEDNMRRGGDWYEETRNFCTMWSMGYKPEHAIAAYAVISPSLNKEQNDKQFVRAISAHRLGMDVTEMPIGVYGKNNRRKFVRCLEGDLTAVGGSKVTSFYKNILGDPAQVTVDRWAVRIAMYNPHLPEAKCVPSSKGCYNAIKAAYISVAEKLGEDPAVIQARTWEAWRGQYYRRSADDYKLTRS